MQCQSKLIWDGLVAGDALLTSKSSQGESCILWPSKAPAQCLPTITICKGKQRKRGTLVWHLHIGWDKDPCMDVDALASLLANGLSEVHLLPSIHLRSKAAEGPF